MSTSETITKTDLKNILEAAGNIGQVDSTPTPTAGKVSEFDAAANINSTDMSASELTTFLENLDPHGSGGGSGTPIPTANTTAAFDSTAHMNSSDMTSAEIDNFVEDLSIGDTVPSSIVDFFYPVGSYYETSDTTFNPNTRWGGTWVLETEGQVHVSAGENYEVGDTGGEASHTILSTEIPDHDHNLTGTGFAAISNYSTRAYFQNTNTDAPTEAGVNQWTTLLGSAGYTWTHNADALITTSTENYNNAKSVNLVGKTGKSANPTSGSDDLSLMQPYIVVNRWHRTA